MSCINIESHLWMDDEARKNIPSPFSSEWLTSEPTGYSGSITLSKANYKRFEGPQYISFHISKMDTAEEVVDTEVQILKDIINNCQSMIRRLLGEEYQRIKELLDVPVEKISFWSQDKRIKKLLLMNDIRTLADLVQCRREDLRSIKYFGGKCITVVIDTLEDLGLTLGMDISEYMEEEQ